MRRRTFLSETPRKLKTFSIPRQVRGFDLASLRESFQSELLDSIFDEEKLAKSYNGDIIADCWFPDSIIPLVPNAELLNELRGPDEEPLYDSSTKQWAPQYLPPVLQKETPKGKGRLPPGEEEKGLSLFMVTIMDALIRRYNRNHVNSPTTAPPATTPPATTTSITTTPTTPIPVLSPIAPSPATTTSITPTPPIPDTSFHPTPPAKTTSNTSNTPTPTTPISPATTPPATTISITPTPTPKMEIPPRGWSSSTATRPLSGDIQIKPDCVLVRQPAGGVSQDLDWADVLMTAELTSRTQTMNLTSQIECRALAMFDAQPNRAFCYSLSFHSGKYRLYMYDRAGGVYSRSYDLHASPLPLLRILSAATFAPASWLGMDDTFKWQLHPVIIVDDIQYFVRAKCFGNSGIRGRATTVWFVSKTIPPDEGSDEIFAVKDSWVNVERQLLEEEILDSLKDVDCIPKVVTAWTVRRGDQDDSTSLRRPESFMSLFKRKCDHRVRRRLLITPAGRPITDAASPLEVATCLLDLVVGKDPSTCGNVIIDRSAAHKKVCARGILHRDVSINNAMMYEEVLPDGTVRVRGLLIDFDYAIRVDDVNRKIGPGVNTVRLVNQHFRPSISNTDLQGTVPFMAIEILRAADNEPVMHTQAHDLESFVYLLCWIIIMYAGPRSQMRETSPKKLSLEGWHDGGEDFATFAAIKEGNMSSGVHLKDVTPYFQTLGPCALALSKIVHEQQTYVRKEASNDWITQADYLTGSKRPHPEQRGDEPLTHDAVIVILHRTCEYLNTGTIPDDTDVSQPYYLTKTHATPLLGDSESEPPAAGPSTSGLHLLDFGGGRYSKRRRIKYRKTGPLE